jgi:hypothetical protein
MPLIDYPVHRDGLGISQEMISVQRAMLQRIEIARQDQQLERLAQESWLETCPPETFLGNLKKVPNPPIPTRFERLSGVNDVI